MILIKRTQHIHLHNIFTHKTQKLLPILNMAKEYPMLMGLFCMAEDVGTLLKMTPEEKMTKEI